MKTRVIRIIIVLMVVLYPFLGSSCSDILNSLSGGDIAGTWSLVSNTGSDHDVCPGEIATFPSSSSGTADLKCPNGQTIQRPYSVSNTTLSYTSTNVSYTITSVTSTKLVLTNSARTLTYAKQ